MKNRADQEESIVAIKKVVAIDGKAETGGVSTEGFEVQWCSRKSRPDV